MRIGPFEFNRNELAGALGDIGVFIPIVAALVTMNGVNVTLALVTAGLLYIAAGAYFRVPVPVQPLKAVAAIAIASGVGPSVLSAAGIWMGVILLTLSLTGFIHRVEKIFNRPVVRGIQLALGFTLVKAGYDLIVKKQFVLGGQAAVLSVAGYSLPYGVFVGIAGIVLILVFRQSKRWPASLIVISLGVILGLSTNGLGILSLSGLGPAKLAPAFPSRADFILALLLLVTPQLPMTLANSIVATSSAGEGYFEARARRLTTRALATSLGVTNLISGLIGGMPLCHGAGGMTAHYKFGARTGGANLMIGGLFIVTGLLFGGSALALMSIVPFSVYGVLLIYLGIEHAILIADSLNEKHDLFIALSIGALSVASGNLFVAVLSGILLKLLTSLSSRFSPWAERARRAA